MPKSYKEIIEHVGYENMKVQALLPVIVKAVDKKRPARTEIAFETNQLSCDEIVKGNPKMVGLILWLPADKIPK